MPYSAVSDLFCTVSKCPRKWVNPNGVKTLLGRLKDNRGEKYFVVMKHLSLIDNQSTCLDGFFTQSREI